MNIPSQQTISTTLIASAAWSLTSCTNNADAFTKGVHTGYLAKRTASPLFQNLKSANVGLPKISGDTKYELGILEKSRRELSRTWEQTKKVPQLRMKR